MDSVNVLQRAHYLPLYSRLGPYPTTLLDHAAYRRPRELFEYWGHEASLIPVELHPMLRWRMAARARARPGAACAGSPQEQPELVAWVLRRGGRPGPADRRRDRARRAPGDRQLGLELVGGQAGAGVPVLGRRGDRRRAHAPPSPAATTCPSGCCRPRVLAAPTPTDAEAYRTLVAIAARSLGVAAEPELRDYFRLPLAGARAGGRRAGRGRRAAAGHRRRAGGSRPSCTRRPAAPLGAGATRWSAPSTR